MPVQVRYYTDPACPRSWAAEPIVRRLMWEFEDELSFSWVMGGLARSFDSPADRVAEWVRITADSGMPIDPRLWLEAPPASSYPACQAVKAAGEQGAEASYAYLRRLREGLLVERKKLDHPEALVAEAAAPGLDVARFRIDLASNATTEAFAADLDEVRTIPAAARAAGATATTDGRERLAFPSAVFASDGGSRAEVWGPRPYEEYRRAALEAGARPRSDRATSPLEAIERFGRLATAEVEALTGRPRPVVEAELWALATEWRLRAVPVLNGTIWEPT